MILALLFLLPEFVHISTFRPSLAKPANLQYQIISLLADDQNNKYSNFSRVSNEFDFMYQICFVISLSIGFRAFVGVSVMSVI